MIGRADSTFQTTPDALFPRLEGNAAYTVHGFLMKLSASGDQVLYSTFLQGVTAERLVVDRHGAAYVMGVHPEPYQTVQAIYTSYYFPISSNAAQTSPGTRATKVIAKFDASGALVYSTYFGGSQTPFSYLTSTHPGDIAVDDNGAVTICGNAGPDLLTSPDAYQTELTGGWEAFITRLSADGTAFERTTFFGATGHDFCDDLELDASGTLFVFGLTTSNNFPTSPGAYMRRTYAGEMLLAATFDKDLTSLRWSTLLDGYRALRMSIGSDGSMLLSGELFRWGFTDQPKAFPEFVYTAFAGRLSADGTKMQSYRELIAQQAMGLEFDAEGSLYGRASFTIYPHSLNAPDGDWGMIRVDTAGMTISYAGAVPGQFQNLMAMSSPAAGKVLAVFDSGGSRGSQLFLLDFTSERHPLVSYAVHPATRMPAPVTPGQWVEFEGIGLGPSQRIQYDATAGSPPEILGETRVLINGAPASVVSAQTYAVQAVIPNSIPVDSFITVEVERDGVRTEPVQVPTTGVQPGVLTANGTGVGPALAWNADRSLNSPQQPALRGQHIRLLATGLGKIGETGNTSAIYVSFNTATAAVFSVTPAEGQPPGVYEVEVDVPFTVAQSDALLIEFQVNGKPAARGVTISVR